MSQKKNSLTKTKKFNKSYCLLFQSKFWLAITQQQIELEMCSNPVKTWEVL